MPPPEWRAPSDLMFDIVSLILVGGRHTVDQQMGECIILHNYDRWENHCRIVTFGRMTCSPIFAFFHLLVVMGQMGEWGLIILLFVTIK